MIEDNSEYRISVGKLRSVEISIFTWPIENEVRGTLTVTMFRGDTNRSYRGITKSSFKRLRRVQDVLIERVRHGYTL